MHQISINGRKFYGPSQWDELTIADLLQLAVHFHFIPDRLRHLQSDYLVYALFKIPKDIKLPRSLIAQIYPCIDWVFGKVEVQSWLIKSIKLPLAKVAGPKDRLADLTTEEFMFCEGAYERWLLDQRKEHLYTLASILYRKKHWFTGKRLPYCHEATKKLERDLKAVRPYILHAVALNYAGCRNSIIARHPDIWRQRDEYQEFEPVTTNKGGTITNWALIVLNLAGDKFGTYAQTLTTNIWLVLSDLNQKSKEYHETMAKLNANK